MRPPTNFRFYAARAKQPPAMTFIGLPGQDLLVEPLGSDDAQRAALRGAFERRMRARAKRLQGAGRR